MIRTFLARTVRDITYGKVCSGYMSKLTGTILTPAHIDNSTGRDGSWMVVLFYLPVSAAVWG